ncbi:HAD hydrolase-like protein [Streptomyces sp. NPDC093228]|uniref:HAD hydrolase-like protein n=1 Tax=Streptomyces sp. NPDC093228 TaxID=3155070 RepID=UPI0034457A32
MVIVTGVCLLTAVGVHVQAVLFDNDGTLGDSTAAILCCGTRWGKEHGPRTHSFDPVKGFGRPVSGFISQIVPAERVAAAAQRYDDLEADDVECLLLPGVDELLQVLPRNRWAVVTSASRRTAEGQLRRVGVDFPASLRMSRRSALTPKCSETGSISRGSSRVNVNWYLYWSLRARGRRVSAREQAHWTVKTADLSGIRECYDPVAGLGQGATSFEWISLVLDLIAAENFESTDHSTELPG